jgi:protein-disulfide isomerase
VTRPLLAIALLTASLGCHGQVPAKASGTTISPELYRRIEIMVRQRAKVPPNYTIEIGPRVASDVAGYDRVDVTFAETGNKSKPIPFLISTDGKTLAQFNKFDIAKDPKTVISGVGRPARGGPAKAPVQIVGFDDLECPYCARMHAQIFPALTERYGDKVRFTYLDFPISQHPWAMRAAIDVNCVGDQNPEGYWNLVDYIHAHASELGGAEHNLQKANDTLDQLALDEAKKDKLKEPEVQACVKKQDPTRVKASLKTGEELEVEATPDLFINGEKFEGAYPLQDLFRFIDAALVAEGETPPPPYVPPAPVTPVAPATTTAPAAKPAN